MIGNSDDGNNFPHKSLLTKRPAAVLCKSFVNKLSASNKLSKTQSSKIIPSSGLLGSPLGPLLKTGLPLMRNVLQVFQCH